MIHYLSVMENRMKKLNMISYAQFVMRCLLKGVKGFGPSDPQERELLDLAAKWRDGKCSPTKGTLARMQKGEYGDAARFAEALSRAMNEHDDDTALELLLEAFNSPLPAYLKIVGKVDRDILRFLKTGECGQYLMPQLKAIVKDPSNMDVKDYCILLLYSFALFDACPDVVGWPFRNIFKREEDSFAKSFVKCVNQGIKLKVITREEITIESVPRKLFPNSNNPRKDWDAHQKPTRFVMPKFLRRIANICFEDDRVGDVYCFMGAYSLIMDKVKEKHKIDFRDLSRKHYDAFRKEAESLYEISDKT